MELRRTTSVVNYIIVTLLLGFLAIRALAQQCGRQAGGALCVNRLCCGQFGYCGNTDAYCGTGCQRQCTSTTPTGPTGDITALFPARFTNNSSNTAVTLDATARSTPMTLSLQPREPSPPFLTSAAKQIAKGSSPLSSAKPLTRPQVLLLSNISHAFYVRSYLIRI